MSAFKENYRKYRKSYIVTFVISLIIGITIFCLTFFLTGMRLLSAVNGVTYSAISLSGLSGLLWVAAQGTFDTMAYGFRQMFSSFFSRKPNKYNDMYSYKEAKNEKREHSPKTYIAMLFAALIFALAIIVLEILYHAI